MLKPEPRTRQTFEYGGWNGTPKQLAEVAIAARRLIPDGDFRATVTRDRGRPELTATDPEALGEVPLNEPTPRIRFEVEAIRLRETDGETKGDRRFVGLTFDRSGYSNQVVCASADEMTSRVFLETVKEALSPGIPWHAALKHREGWTVASLILGSLTITLGAGLTVQAVTGRFLWGVLTALFLALPTGPVLVRAENWLFPMFELYDERPRRRRFGVWVLSAILLPFAVAWLIRR